MRKVIGLVLLVVALAAMVGTVSAQVHGGIEPFRAHSRSVIVEQ